MTTIFYFSHFSRYVIGGSVLSCFSRVWLFATPWTVAFQAPLGRRNPSWDSPGKNTGVGSLSLFQGIFPNQGLNWGFLHCRWTLYQLSYQGNPKWWLTMVLICLSLMTNDVKCLLMYSLAICVTSGDRDVLLPLVRSACFLTVRFWEFFLFSVYKSLIGYVICKYFLLVSSLSFNSVFNREKFLIFMESSISTFPFVDCAFKCHILELFTLFQLISFYSFTFGLQSIWDNFNKVWRFQVNVYLFTSFFAHGCPVVSAPFVVEMAVLAPWNCFWIFVKTQLAPVVWGCFWALS